MPAYNEAATIASSIQSLLQRRYPNYEVVVVNDGAKNDTINWQRLHYVVLLFSGLSAILC